MTDLQLFKKFLRQAKFRKEHNAKDPENTKRYVETVTEGLTVIMFPSATFIFGEDGEIRDVEWIA
jgi:hypothetical protein